MAHDATHNMDSQLSDLLRRFERSSLSAEHGMIKRFRFDPLRQRSQRVHGLCGPVARALCQMLAQAGYECLVTDADHLATPAAHGYECMPFGPLDRYGQPMDFSLAGDHCAALVFVGDRAYLIDYAAAQYGYDAFPLVQYASRSAAHIWLQQGYDISAPQWKRLDTGAS